MAEYLQAAEAIESELARSHKVPVLAVNSPPDGPSALADLSKKFDDLVATDSDHHPELDYLSITQTITLLSNLSTTSTISLFFRSSRPPQLQGGFLNCSQTQHATAGYQTGGTIFPLRIFRIENTIRQESGN